MVKVYGCSDDLVEIENSEYPEGEIDCYDDKVTIWFDDNTVIEVNYDNDGIWRIKEIQGGHAPRNLNVCKEDSEDDYSDVFEINADVIDHCVGEVIEEVQELKSTFRQLKMKYPITFIQKAYEEVFE